MTSGESGRTAVTHVGLDVVAEHEGGDSDDGSGWYGSCKILIKMRNIHTARTQSAKLNGAEVNRDDTGRRKERRLISETAAAAHHHYYQHAFKCLPIMLHNTIYIYILR